MGEFVTMAMTVGDKTWKTTFDPLYLNGKLVKTVRLNGTLVYPDHLKYVTVVKNTMGMGLNNGEIGGVILDVDGIVAVHATLEMRIESDAPLTRTYYTRRDKFVISLIPDSALVIVNGTLRVKLSNPNPTYTIKAKDDESRANPDLIGGKVNIVAEDLEWAFGGGEFLFNIKAHSNNGQHDWTDDGSDIPIFIGLSDDGSRLNFESREYKQYNFYDLFYRMVRSSQLERLFAIDTNFYGADQTKLGHKGIPTMLAIHQVGRQEGHDAKGVEFTMLNPVPANSGPSAFQLPGVSNVSGYGFDFYIADSNYDVQTIYSEN